MDTKQTVQAVVPPFSLVSRAAQARVPLLLLKRIPRHINPRIHDL
jgi:hypothetical protein